MGLVIMGISYSALIIEQTEGQMYYTVMQNPDAEQGANNLKDPPVPLQIQRALPEGEGDGKGEHVAFSISMDGENFTETGEIFEAEQGKWIGAKVGLYALGSRQNK